MSSKIKTGSLDKNGNEVLDSTPMEIPVGFMRPPSIQQQIQRLVRTELSDAAGNRGDETFEESEDFGEEPEDFSTPIS